MKILYLYIGRNFLKNLAISLSGLTLLLLVSSLLSELNTVFSGVEGAKAFLNQIIQTVPVFLERLLPMTVLFAAIFTFNSLGRTSELVAMKAIGFGPNQMMTPIVALLVPIAMLAYFNQHYLQVWTQPEDPAQGAEQRNTHQWRLLGDHFYYYQRLDPQKGTLQNVRIFQWRQDPASITMLQQANVGHREGEGWRLDGLRQQTQQGDSWSIKKGGSPLIQGDAFPDVYKPADLDAHHTPFFTLHQEINTLESQGRYVEKYRQEWYEKPAALYALFLMALLGASLSQSHFRKSKGGGDMVLTIGLGIAYWIATEIFRMLGMGGYLPPLLAAWSANLLFTGLTLRFYLDIR